MVADLRPRQKIACKEIAKKKPLNRQQQLIKSATQTPSTVKNTRPIITKPRLSSTKQPSILPIAPSSTTHPVGARRFSASSYTSSSTTAAGIASDKISALEARIKAIEAANESRFIAIETSYKELVSENNELRHSIVTLKGDCEGIQYVISHLLGVEAKFDECEELRSSLAAENTELKGKFSELSSEVTLLKSESINLRAEVKQLQSQIETQKQSSVNDITFEQQRINSNIIIRGVEVEANANKDHLLDTFNQIRSHLGVSEVSDFEPVDIGFLPTNNTSDKNPVSQPKTIQVKFHSVDQKRRFLQIRRTKKTLIPSEIGLKQKSRKPILIVEQLTRQNQELLYNARSLRTSANFKFVWSNNGQILARLRQGSKVNRIEDINQINRLKLQFASSTSTDGFIHPVTDIQSNSGVTQA